MEIKGAADSTTFLSRAVVTGDTDNSSNGLNLLTIRIYIQLLQKESDLMQEYLYTPNLHYLMAPGTKSSKFIYSKQKKGNGLWEIEENIFSYLKRSKQNCDLTLLWYAGLGIVIKIPCMAEYLPCRQS